MVDDPKQFLTPAQVSALIMATPWPYNVLVHTAAWAGLRAGELAGLTVGDVELPPAVTEPECPDQARLSAGAARGEGHRGPIGLRDSEDAWPQSAGIAHPRGDGVTARLPRGAPQSHDPSAPLWPGMALARPRPTGVAASLAEGDPAASTAKVKVRREAEALAELSVAEAGARLVLGWTAPLRHPTFYKKRCTGLRCCGRIG